jgi:hypothetical protein
LRRWPALLLASSVWATAGVARAEATAATLVVTRGAGAEDCPTAEGLAERVRAIGAGRLLQTNLQQPSATWVYLELTHDLGRYTAFLQTRGRQQGSRTLSDVSANCASLSDAVAVTLALLLDEGQPTSKPAPPPTLREPSSAPRPSRKKPRYAVSLGGGVGIGLLAETTPSASAGLDTTLGPHLRLGIGAGTTLPQRVHYLQGYTELQLSWGYARACALVGRSKSGVELSVCASPMLGALSGAGKRYDFSAKKRWLWAALAGGPELSGPLSEPSFWWISAMAIAPLTLRGFAVTVDGKRHDTFVVKSFAASASLGLGVRF